MYTYIDTRYQVPHGGGFNHNLLIFNSFLPLFGDDNDDAMYPFVARIQETGSM